jgi:hypothetical protein
MGAKRLINTATVKPIKKGPRLAVGAARFRGLVRAKITNTSTAVPNPSTQAACQGDTSTLAASPVPNGAGFGKYSPKIIAESSLPGAPRTSPLVASKRMRNGQKSQATAGGKGCRSTISDTATRPPGLSTRAISCHTWGLSEERLSPQLEWWPGQCQRIARGRGRGWRRSQAWCSWGPPLDLSKVSGSCSIKALISSRTRT